MGSGGVEGKAAGLGRAAWQLACLQSGPDGGVQHGDCASFASAQASECFGLPGIYRARMYRTYIAAYLTLVLLRSTKLE